MTIKPLGNKVQLKIEEPTVGGLDLSSKKTSQEYGEVLAIGRDVTNVNIKDKIMFKAWCVDVITYEGENYYFINADSEGLCAIFSEK